jgi:general secretion pathway protein N
MPNVATDDAPRARALPKLVWIVPALIFWLIFVLLQVPAHWAAWAMTRSGDLALSGISGTFWSGRASLASVQIEQESFSLGELRWELNPWSLLALSPCAQIQTQLDRQQLRARVCASLKGNLTISDADISAPATVIQRLVPDDIDGQLSARIERLQVNAQGLRSLKGTGSWHNVRVHNGVNWIAVGSYAADLSDDSQGNVVADIFHLDGALGLDVRAVLNARGGANLSGTMTMTQAFSDEIQAPEWVVMFAREDGRTEDGRIRYQLDLDL